MNKNKETLRAQALNIIDNAQAEMRDLTDAEQQELDTIKEAMTEVREADDSEKEKDADAVNEETPTDGDTPTAEDDDTTEEVEDEKEEETNKRNKSNIRMKQEFRLIKAIRDVANNRSLDAMTKAVSEAGAEEMRKSGLSFGGQIQLPLESRTITVADTHDDLVETDFTNILEPLRAKNVLVEAGAKYLNNLVGDVQVPVMTASNVGWAGEIAEAADGAGTFDHVTLSPKRLTAYIDLSKQFLAQDSLAAEELIRRDLVNAINNKLEATILSDGNGVPTTPDGIFSVVTPSATVNGFSDLCDLEASLDDANVNGNKVYLVSNKAKAALRAMPKSSKVVSLVYEAGEIDGTKAINTSHISDKSIIYGDFSNLAIGQWGSIDLTIDPYTKAASGQVRIVVNCYFDAKVLRKEAFAAGKIA